MTKIQILTKVAELERQLARDKSQFVSLTIAVVKAWLDGNAELAERLGYFEERLAVTIAAEEWELQLLGYAASGPFKIADAKSVRLLTNGQAVVTLPGPGGKTIQRHVHLKNYRDKFGNDYMAW